MKDFKTLNFLMSPELQQLKSVLIDRSNEEFRFVGGCVRDALLLVKANDIDICTTATPEGVIALARSNRLQVVPTGLKHGTVSVIVNGVPFEITTLRVDTETDGRHAVVRWTKSFEEDASRRDFTYNAMSIDFEGNFYDYFDGIKDLRFCNTVFVGDATERIREDYLRVLRYFRFVARFNSTIDDNILCLMHDRQVKEGLAQISKERVWAEMSKLLMFSSRYRVMQALFNCGIAAVIRLDYAPQTLLNAADDAVAALASFELTIDNAKALASDWKLSTVERAKLSVISCSSKTL
jgi:tRNA nucleotidyltransferase/poly(A) polymerase